MRKDLEAILEASDRASTLTRQLLTFSRRQMVEPRVLDLNRHIARVSRMLRRVIREDIELVTLLKADPARIKADPAQIEQVLLNVAVNAKDAMPKGGKLTVETAYVDIAEEADQEAFAIAAKALVLRGALRAGRCNGTMSESEGRL